MGSTVARVRIAMVLGRLLWTVPVVLVVLAITFGLMHVAPGNPWDRSLDLAAHGVVLDDQTVRNLRVKYGLDESLPEQFAVYLANAVRLDFGDSFRYEGQSVRTLIARRWTPTLILGVLSFAVSVSAGVGLGVLAALRQNSALDYALIGLATFGASIPSFIVGLLLILTFSVGLNRVTDGAFFLPLGGFGLDQRLIMPVVTLSILPLAYLARLVRSGTLETLSQEHVVAARAKGLRESVVIVRHVLKNSLIPVVTALGPLLAFLLTGSVVAEVVFQVPGIAGLFVDAVSQRDYPVILGTTVVFTAVIALANLVVDVTYTFLDPRMQPLP